MLSTQELKAKGVKITKHKLVVLRLFDIYKHLHAAHIYSLLRDQGVNISLATIYRTLAVFEAHNIITRHTFNEDQAIYELTNPNEHHDHLICIRCNKVIEFLDCKIEQIQQKIAKDNKFEIVNHHLNIYGICQDCNKI